MDKFYEYMFKTCRDNKIRITFHPNELYNGCSGFFDSANKELSICLDKPKKTFYRLILHEFAHVLQFIEDDPLFIATYKWAYIFEDMDNWHKYQKKDLISTFKAHKMVEADCEKRVIKLIKEFNLDINIKEYCQYANAYIYFYDILPIIKRWYKSPLLPPYQVKEIIDIMPTDLNRDYKKLPSKYKKVYLNYYD